MSPLSLSAEATSLGDEARQGIAGPLQGPISDWTSRMERGIVPGSLEQEPVALRSDRPLQGLLE